MRHKILISTLLLTLFTAVTIAQETVKLRIDASVYSYISINDVSRYTPIEIDVALGKYLLTAYATGYSVQQQVVEVSDDVSVYFDMILASGWERAEVPNIIIDRVPSPTRLIWSSNELLFNTYQENQRKWYRYNLYDQQAEHIPSAYTRPANITDDFLKELEVIGYIPDQGELEQVFQSPDERWLLFPRWVDEGTRHWYLYDAITQQIIATGIPSEFKYGSGPLDYPELDVFWRVEDDLDEEVIIQGADIYTEPSTSAIKLDYPYYDYYYHRNHPWSEWRLLSPSSGFLLIANMPTSDEYTMYYSELVWTTADEYVLLDAFSHRMQVIGQKVYHPTAVWMDNHIVRFVDATGVYDFDMQERTTKPILTEYQDHPLPVMYDVSAAELSPDGQMLAISRTVKAPMEEILIRTNLGQ